MTTDTCWLKLNWTPCTNVQEKVQGQCNPARKHCYHFRVVSAVTIN